MDNACSRFPLHTYITRLTSAPVSTSNDDSRPLLISICNLTHSVVALYPLPIACTYPMLGLLLSGDLLSVPVPITWLDPLEPRGFLHSRAI